MIDDNNQCGTFRRPQMQTETQQLASVNLQVTETLRQLMLFLC